MEKTKILALLTGFIGIILLFATFYPIVSYKIKAKNSSPLLISPISDTGSIESDYTKASNWFVGGKKPQEFYSTDIKYYQISIPKLKIENASVAYGGEDLSKHLIQYPGTAYPGKKGNAVIFGHSILPSFYNPKDYESIFSLLPDLEKGDEIYLNYEGVNYTYRVEKMFEVYPNDIQVLEQNSSDSFLTLVTCVPPGDPRKPKRLIVRARVV